jgi:hypothetical protein
MLLELRASFMKAFSAVAPDLVNHPWIQEWLNYEAKN